MPHNRNYKMDLINATSIKYFNNPDGSGSRTIEVTYPENADGSRKKLCVPIAEDNTEYQQIQEWVEEGNTIEEAD